MLKLFVIGLGGFLGAIIRYGLSGLLHRHTNTSFPIGTLAVNVLGCFVIGGLMCLVEEREFFAPNVRLFLLVGLIGSFTTFSTVGYETFELLRAGDFRMAGVNALANLLIGVVAVILGWASIRTLGI